MRKEEGGAECAAVRGAADLLPAPTFPSPRDQALMLREPEGGLCPSSQGLNPLIHGEAQDSS